MGKIGRPRMTRKDYLVKYRKVIFELRYMEKSLRRIAKEEKVGLSTVMRLKKKFAL
jgi:transposase